MNPFAETSSIEELDTAIAKANETAAPLVEKGRNGEPLTPEERQTLAEILAERGHATERKTVLEAEAATAKEEQDALLSQFETPEVEPEQAPEVEAEVTPITPEAPAAVVPAEPVVAEPVVQETPVAVAASAAPKTPPARRQVPQPAAPVTAEVQGYGATVAIVASGNSDVGNSGTVLELSQVSEILLERVQSMPAPDGDGKGRNIQKMPVAKFNITRPKEFVLTGDEAKDQELIAAALDPNRLEGANGAKGLVAAGGWCAPSEVLYGIPAVGESLDGMVSIPEMNAARGGVRSTTGPDFASLYASIGFTQTEAQAIAGETKDCYEVECPTFTETRMDVMGVCLIVPILTEAGYPELVQRITSGALVVHAHKMNASKLARMEAASTTKTALDLGTTAESTLHTLELRAEYTRQVYRMAFNETLEVVLPHWVRAYLREDLALRMGLDPRNPITDQVLEAHFAARHLAVQWVYDWQTMADPTTAATTFKAMIYPAGTFLGLTKDVISLSAVYDAASLATNTYTGTFTEEGIAVRKMSGVSEVVTLPICSRGRVGAANLTCA